MKIEVVTTFHQKGLDSYAQKFIDSFSRNVDSSIALRVYAESCTPINPDPSQIIVIDAAKEIVALNKFKEKWRDVPKANGTYPIYKRSPLAYIKYLRRYKWNAIRFANKVYAVLHAAETTTADWLVWMDADMYVHSPISKSQFDDLLDPDYWITYVGRGQNVRKHYPETGFFGLNLGEKSAKRFLKTFETFYEDAENGIFQLEEWHDAYVFGHILSEMKPAHPGYFDYSENSGVDFSKAGGLNHPLINGVLGTWFDHMKGRRKVGGKSTKSDLIVRRQESYWTER